MGLLLPEEMRHGTLLVQSDRARDVVAAVGSRSCVQFEDMNIMDAHRPYRKHIQRIDEMERTIRYLHEEILRLHSPEDIVSGNIDSFLEREEAYSLNEVEQELARFHKDFGRLRESADAVLRTRTEAVEAHCVAQVAAAFAKEGRRPSLTSAQPTLAVEEASQQLLSTVAGLVKQQDQQRFMRAIFRATYGNVFIHMEPLGNVLSDVELDRQSFMSAFVLVFQNRRQGMQETALAERIRRLCDAFGARVYPRYASAAESQAACAELDQQIKEQAGLLQNLQRYMLHEAGRLCRLPHPRGNSLIEEWRLFCLKEKAIYATLNCFEAGGISLRVDCWYPVREEEGFKNLLSEFSTQRPGSFQGVVLIPDKKQVVSGAPTYVRTNGLTEAVQLMVDTYGPPRYREANPALFTVVTFPFLFGVMYGDVGHGFSLLLAGLYLVRQGDSLRNSAPTLYSCRYLVTMMGLFGTYCGLLYNDFFSVGIPLFASRWGVAYEEVVIVREFGSAGCELASELSSWSASLPEGGCLERAGGDGAATYIRTSCSDLLQGVVYKCSDKTCSVCEKVTADASDRCWAGVLGFHGEEWTCTSRRKTALEARYDTLNQGGPGPYPFGIDWSWHGAQNELIFMNSLKMKLSVILGVVHMLSGLALRCFNTIFNGSVLDLVCECVPMIMFMLCFFGFMDLMILYKWVTPLDGSPSIINSMICMAIPGTKDPAPMFGAELPSKLMTYSLLAVPWLLVPKPLLLWARAKFSKPRVQLAPPRLQGPRRSSLADSPPLLGVELAATGAHVAAAAAAADEEVAGFPVSPLEGKGHGDEEEPFDIAEVLIHQTIETIEFVLGTVSHVASYLRLWALSLAHQQLSEVFFRYTIGVALGMGFPANVVGLYIMFAVWAGITTAVLLGMDVMECFLHTLRLHWVEFQSKFYKADGHPFQPLSFRERLMNTS